MEKVFNKVIGDPLSAPMETTLYLTPNRTIQQEQRVLDTDCIEVKLNKLIHNASIKAHKQKIAEIRQLKLGKNQKFKTYKTKPFFCGNNKGVFINVDANGLKSVNTVPIRCNLWSCPNCQPIKIRIIKRLFREVIELNNLNRLLSLTLDPNKVPEEYLSRNKNINNTHKYITKLFNHFLTILRRKYKKLFKDKLKYLWVIEYQENGNAHLHILINKFLFIKMIRGIWLYVGGGHIMKIEQVKTASGITSYLTNYLVKGLKTSGDELNSFHYMERRYSISKSCIRPKRMTVHLKYALENKWVIDLLEKNNLNWVYNMLQENGDLPDNCLDN